LDFESNVIDPIAFDLPELPAKHDLHRISTEQGMQIDWIEQYWKHDLSIRFNLDSESNAIDPITFDLPESPAKHDLHRSSTEQGIQID
jgi:hypothetical protein